MPSVSEADHSVSPPQLKIPREYNAAHDLIERNLQAGRSAKIAYIDDNGEYSYGELAQRVNRICNVLVRLGLQREDRLMLAHLDDIDFPSTFLAAIKAGIVPIATNTLLTPNDYDFMLRDSRAKALVVSSAIFDKFKDAIEKSPYLKYVVVSGAPIESFQNLRSLMDQESEDFVTVSTVSDEPCFWLYSSGSTGTPKGTVHVHSSMIQTAELYARPILGIRESDVIFSAAKLFFAYGLGNALSFPMSVGATTILMAERPTPDSVFKRLKERRPTIFCGVPTLFGAMMASVDLPKSEDIAVRISTSAGEALPADLGERWTKHFGSEILDGIGSTEMLHIFLSNRPGEVNYGTTGKPVPGYQIRLVGENDQEVGIGELGELQIKGPTSAAYYWNQREKSMHTFVGEWTRAGDKYSKNSDGYFTYGGRSDDMLKVSGMYVSPFEVEAALMSHPDVLEAAIVGDIDEENLVKPRAFVVMKQGQAHSEEKASELKQHVKNSLAPFKYPRWINFVDELPKTATGKIQRFKLRK